MKPYFIFLGLSIFFLMCVVYVKNYGWGEFQKWLMTQALNYMALLVGFGMILDLLRERE